MSFPVKGRHPGRFKKWLSDVVVPQTFDFLCGRANAPSSLFGILDAAPVATPPPTQPTEQPPPTPAFPGAVPAASNLIQRNLTEFWTNSQPDLPYIDDPPIVIDDLWDEIRQRTAPWDTDVWGESPPTSEPSSIGDAGTEDDERLVILTSWPPASYVH